MVHVGASRGKSSGSLHDLRGASSTETAATDQAAQLDAEWFGEGSDDIDGEIMSEGSGPAPVQSGSRLRVDKTAVLGGTVRTVNCGDSYNFARRMPTQIPTLRRLVGVDGAAFG